MDRLTQLLKLIKSCNACRLMTENNMLNIPYIPIIPKSNAKAMFIGRDPSPRTAKNVGVRGGKSAFINEVFSLSDEANVPEDYIYITDMCKCHWRTSRGIPWEGTEERSTYLPKDISEACIQQWLLREVEILKPKVIISFGEELYKLLRCYITRPEPSPPKLSATRDKSKMDAELYFSQGGNFAVKLGTTTTALIPMRHPGNTISLVRSDLSDKRWAAYQASRKRAVKLLNVGSCPF